MKLSCPRCRGSVESALHGGLFTDRCVCCGWEQSGTANSAMAFGETRVAAQLPQGAAAHPPAVEVEHEFWVTVSLRGPLTPAQLHALRATSPHRTEPAQSFMARVKGVSELRTGPFWPKPRATLVLQVLSDAGLEGIIDV